MHVDEVKPAGKQNDRGSVQDAAFFLPTRKVGGGGAMSVSVEGIADGSAQAKNAVGVEIFGVIDDVVVMGFGPEKEVSPYPIAESSAYVNQKMIAVQVSGTATRVNATTVRVVIQHGLAAHAGREDRAGSLRDAGGERVEFGGKNGVEVVKQRAKFLIVVVEPLFISKGEFATVPKAVLNDAVEAGARVEATSLWRRQVRQGSGIVSGGEQSVSADGEVHLLSRSESGKQKNRTHRRDSRDLSQIQPPLCFVPFLKCIRWIGGLPGGGFLDWMIWHKKVAAGVPARGRRSVKA